MTSSEEYLRLLHAERTARELAEEARERSAFLVAATELLAASLDSASAVASVARLGVSRVADAVVVEVVEGGDRRKVVAARDDAGRAAVVQLVEELPIIGDRPTLIAPGPAGPTDEPAEAALRRAGFGSVAWAPMKLRAQEVGAVFFASGSDRKRYAAEDLQMAVELARHVALAVENARLHRAAQASITYQELCLRELQEERARLERARKEAEAAAAMKDEFLATVSHELRAPLAALLMWEHVLRSGAADEALRARALEAIRVSAHLQSRLIEDLLDVSRCISGKMHLDLAPTRMAEVVLDAIDTVGESAAAKGIVFDTDLERCGARVMGDAARMTQVVGNLLSNAVKFSRPGSRVAVKLEDGRGCARLIVRDQGEGIDGAFLPHVFEAFRQADGTSTRAHGGLGLGLAVVKHLVAMHGGTVTAHSDGPGRGATFTVQLPEADDVTVSTHPGLGALAAELPATAAALDGLSVVVVDDEEDVRDGIVAVLEGAGARVVGCASARLALEEVRRCPPDVLLSDVAMPGEDGYALIRKVRALDGLGARVRAVAVTARATATDRRMALEAGFEAHLAKPFEPPDLVSLVALLGAPATGPASGGQGQSEL